MHGNTRLVWFQLRLVLLAASNIVGTVEAQVRAPAQVRTRPDSPRVVQRVRPTTLLPQRLQMPALIDSTEAVARRILYLMKFKPVVTERPTTDSRQDGRVFDQQPAAGRPLARGDTVKLAVYRYVPPVMVTVPRLAGRPLVEAIATLRDSSLTPRPPRISRADIMRAVVDSHSPGPGARVKAGSPVALSVTITTIVPWIVGQDGAAATGVLASSGLAIRFRGREYSDAMPAGRVVRQHPDSGTVTRQGDSVGVWLSLGAHPPDPGFPMPRVVDLALDAARDTLQAHRLRITHVDTVTDASRAGIVVDQKPPPRSPVHAADAVDLRVAIAPRPRRVPWVVGRSRVEASRVLADSGFGVRVTVVPDSTRSDDVVIAQRPDSGLPRRPVTVVTIDVVDSVGPPPPQPESMPRVYGMTRGEAEAALAFLSPRLTITERPTAREDENGRVVEQYPLPQARVFPDLEVLLTFARYEPPQRDTSAPPGTPVIVPQLIDRRIGEARALLRAANLHLGDLGARFDVAPESVVVGQNPDSGVAVAAGTAVAVTLRQEPPPPPPIPPQDGDDGIDWRWWLLLIPGGGMVGGVAWWLKHKPPPEDTRHPDRPHEPPRVHAELKQRAFEPPRVVREDDDPVVKIEVAFVNRAPESSIEAPGSLILREERL